MTAEPWALGEVGNALDKARDQGETRDVTALREECGVGHDDLSDVLNALREQGLAVEAAPGEWRRPFDGETDVGAGAEDAGPGAAEAALDRFDGRGEEDEPSAPASPGRRAHPTAAAAVAAGEGEVRMTMAVAGALKPETMGELVAAGMEEAKEAGRAFVLRVEP